MKDKCEIVIFSKAEDRYAKWFFGQIGTVISSNNGHYRVRWMQPIKYFDKMVQVSDFPVDKFTRVK